VILEMTIHKDTIHFIMHFANSHLISKGDPFFDKL